MSVQSDFEELLKATSALNAKFLLLDRVEFACRKVELRMQHNATIVETERHVRFAKQMDHAIDQIVVHVVISIVTLGLTAAVEAVMAAAYVAEGAAASTAGIRYANAARAWEQAISTGSMLERGSKVWQIANNPAIRNVLLEYQFVKGMVQAPAMCIDYALQEWAKYQQGREYDWKVPESPEKDGGTFLRDEKGNLRKPGKDFLQLAKQIYDYYHKVQEEERTFLTKMAARAHDYYKRAIESGFGSLGQGTQYLLALDNAGFAKLDTGLEQQINNTIRKQEPNSSENDRYHMRAEVLRGYWMKPWGELSQRSSNLQIEVNSLANAVRQKSEALQASIAALPPPPTRHNPLHRPV